MLKFISTTTNKVDRKGRVSVPALFRANIPQSGYQGIFAYKSFKHRCIEGSDTAFIESLSLRINTDFGFFSDENEALANAVLAKLSQLSFDPEGRILIPKDFLSYAEITDSATFVGLGNKFQIWNPLDYERHFEQQLLVARKEAKKLGPFGKEDSR